MGEVATGATQWIKTSRSVEYFCLKRTRSSNYFVTTLSTISFSYDELCTCARPLSFLRLSLSFIYSFHWSENGLWAVVVADRNVRMADWRLFSKVPTRRLQWSTPSTKGGWYSPLTRKNYTKYNLRILY